MEGFSEEDTVDELKSKICDLLEVSEPAFFRIVFEGRGLAEEKRASDCGIQAESVVYLVPRLRPST